jgi:hypothetical protein
VRKIVAGDHVLYKFKRTNRGHRLGLGVEVEARAIVTRVHEEDSTVDLEIVSWDGCHTFRRVVNGMAEGQWRSMSAEALI